MKNTFSSGNNREIHGYGQQTNASCVVFSWMTLIFLENLLLCLTFVAGYVLFKLQATHGVS